MALEKYDEAAAYYQKAIALDPENEVRSRIELARAHKRRSRLGEAIVEVTKAIELEGVGGRPDRTATAYWNRACYRALALQKSGDQAANVKGQIIEDLQKSIQLEPEFRKDLLTEKDLTSIADLPEFRAISGHSGS